MNQKKSSWHRVAAVLTILVVLVSSVPGLAQTGPETMGFQGRLLDSGGNPRGGETHCMRFRICTDASSEASCTASKVWPVSAGHEYHGVTTESGTYKAGLFTVALGSVEPIPAVLMYDSDTLYLEIGVSDDGASCDGVDETYTLMDPPSQLRVSAFAQRSRRVRSEESDDDFLISVSNTGQGGGIYAKTNSSTFEAAAGSFEVAENAGMTAAVYAANHSSADGSVGLLAGVGVSGGQAFGAYVVNSSIADGGEGGHFEARGSSGVTYGVHGLTNSADGYGVYGEGPKVGVRGVGDTAASTGPGVDVGVWGDSATGDGVWGVTDSSADQSTGVRGWANAASGATYGVYGSNQSSSNGARGVYGYAMAASGTTYGVYGEAASLSGRGVYGQGGFYGVYGEGSDPTGATYGVWGQSTGAIGYGVWGQSTHRDGVHGASTNGNGVYGVTSSGSDYGVFGESAWVGVKGIGGSASSVATAGDMGVWGDSNSGDGVWGTTDYTANNSSGVLGWAKGASGQTSGVWGYNDSTADGARGVYGYAAASTGKTIGVRGESLSASGTGVYGTAPLTGTVGIATNVIGGGVGVYGKTLSESGVGVYGYATAYSGITRGVAGRINSTTDGAAAGRFDATGITGKTYGIHATNNSSTNWDYWDPTQAAAAGRFYATSTPGSTFAVFATNHSGTSGAAAGYFRAANRLGETYGVYGRNDSQTSYATAGYFWASSYEGKTYGVYGQTDSSTDGATAGRFKASGATGITYGVYAENNSDLIGYGVYGLNKHGQGYGVAGVSQSADGGDVAVFAHASNSSSNGIALWARSAGSGDIIRGYSFSDMEFRVTNAGDVRADGTFTSPAADFAEMLPAVPGLEPGDLLAIGTDGKLVRSSQAYQGSVAGAYSTKPGFLGGAGMDEDLEGKVPLAVVGVVPVKVSAENGAIRPGDLLVASSLPGHAMRAEPVEVNGVSFYLPGTIIGKALESWDAAQGTGVILVLVTLQ